MRRIVIAFRAFFLALFNRQLAEQIDRVLQQRLVEAPAEPTEEAPKRAPAVKPKTVVRSEAISLLAALQREARFVDFLQEPLAGYSDAQVGAVARDVHRDCAAVVERLFALKPAVAEAEGSQLELPAAFDSGRYRLTGNVAGEPPFRGQVVHHGWEAARCEVPAWSGSADAARVVAPCEVELK